MLKNNKSNNKNQSNSCNKPFKSPFKNVDSLRRRTFPFDHKSLNRSLLSKIPTIQSSPKDDGEDNDNSLEAIQVRVEKKKQEIEKLKNSMIYRKKHNVAELKVTIEKWKKGCQQALEVLLRELQQRQDSTITMEQLLDMHNIPKSLVNYSSETDSFN